MLTQTARYWFDRTTDLGPNHVISYPDPTPACVAVPAWRAEAVRSKYEFGLDEDGASVIADEIHTPDSSRFWIAERCDPAVAVRRRIRDALAAELPEYC